MNTINKTAVILLGVASLGFASCSKDAFNKYPTDSMQMETYVSDDSEALNVLYDAYYYLREVSYNVISLSGLVTDEAYNHKMNNGIGAIELNECSWDKTCGTSSSLWNQCYSMINRCNTILDKIENVSSAEKRAQFVAEAKFLRAYAYFNLVRLFGDVPLTTSVISNYLYLYDYPREAKSKVYAQIIEDLKDASSNLPESYSAANEKGRVTKIAAWTMLGEVYMTLNDFASAKAELAKVVAYSEANPGKLGLEANVRDIYEASNPNGKEVILAGQYNFGATSVTNYFMRACIINGAESQPAYVDANGNASVMTTSVGAGGLMMTYELYNKLRSNPADQRYKQLVYAKWYDTKNISEQSDEVDVIKVEGVNYGIIPTSLKYYDFNVLNLSNCNASTDNLIYRYAGVLLMYAECLNETDSAADAAKYLNMVRSRAGLENSPAKTKSELRLAIEDESLLELCLEGHRYFDLVRTGRINDVMDAHFNHRTVGLSVTFQSSDNGMVVNSASDTKPQSTAKWRWSGTSTPVLFPIPYDQIQLTKWEQNPLY